MPAPAVPEIPQARFQQGQSASYLISDAYTDTKSTVSFTVTEVSDDLIILAAVDASKSGNQEYRLSLDRADTTQVKSAEMKNKNGSYSPVKPDTVWFVPLFFFNRTELKNGYYYTSQKGCEGTEYGYKIDTTSSSKKYAFNASNPLFAISSATVKHKNAYYAVSYTQSAPPEKTEEDCTIQSLGGG